MQNVGSVHTIQRIQHMLNTKSPTPLSTIVKTVVPDKIEPSAQQNFKIMRRKKMGEIIQQTESGEVTVPSSADPSKATSEVGGDSQSGTGMVSPTESNVAKDKASMTREEREAKYKETRERIFKGFECAEGVELPVTNESTNATSRTGSRTGKKKTWKSRNNDGSFELRSQYSLGYHQQQCRPTAFEQMSDSSGYFNQYQFQQQHQFDPNQSGQLTTAAYQQGYTQALQTLMSEPGYAMGFQHAQMFSNMAANGQPMAQPLGQHMPTAYGLGVPNVNFQQFYPQMAQAGQHSPVASSPAISHPVHVPRPQSQPSNQPWLQPYPPYSYQQNHHHLQGGAPFPNDQMHTGSAPYQSSPVNLPNGNADGSLQQPMPGSYHPQIFNPQTNPFIPGHVGSQFPSMQPQNQANDGNQYQTNNLTDNNPNQFFGTMQGSSQTHYFEPSTTVHGHADYMHDPIGNSSHRGGSGDVRSDANSVHSISKWNAPASLPPKPPPPEITNGLQTPSPRATLPYNTRHSGQHVPTFQNGVYTLPVMSGR